MEKTILIVEDDDAVRELVADSLRLRGFSVVAVPLAGQALEALRSGRFDLIVLDLGMPRGTMDGMELLVRIREVGQWRSLPVVILSGYGDFVNRDVTERLGVAAILSKPLSDLEQIVTAVQRILGSEAAPS